jgi:lipopolysaccharide export system protein LptC
MGTRKMSIEGPITAKNDGYSITTGQVEIDSSEGLLKTNEEGHIKGKKFVLQGRGMERKKNEQNVMILKDVKATFNN